MDGLEENINQKHVKLIGDIAELRWFYDHVLPPLAPLEVYYLSLSARSKYLSESDKSEIILGRNEMFAKSIIREHTWERFIRTIRKLECSEEGYTTKNNLPIPSKCIVCYLNINPSNTIKALYEFQKVYNEYMMELAEIAVRGRDSENIMNRLNKIDNNLMTCYQKATGNRHWIDIDMDVDKAFSLHTNSEFLKYMNSKKICNYPIVETKSGYHVLINILELQEAKLNPYDIVATLDMLYTQYCDTAYGPGNDVFGKAEIILNKNAMIPLPGTIQGGHIVRVLNK